MPTSTNKPYRVYRQPRRVEGDGSIPWEDFETDRKLGKRRRSKGPKSKRRVWKYLRRTILVAVLASAVWGGIAFYAFRGAVQKSNARVPEKVREVLTPTDGPAIASQRNILVIGSDSRGADDPGRTDSMIIVHTDPKSRSYSMLSIPRDLKTDVPGYKGKFKINQAYTLGKEPLAIKTVKELTGLPIHHYVFINFSGFKQVVDNLGGIEIDNPRPIKSNRFDGRVWKFSRGRIHLTGRRALAYSRVRKNQLNPNESDITRGQRQQAVLDAIAAKILVPSSLFHPGAASENIMTPLTTEITASQMVAFGMIKEFAKKENTLKCRLGGESMLVEGQDMLVGDDVNRETIAQFMFQQPPQKPFIQSNQFAPGCLRPGETATR